MEEFKSKFNTVNNENENLKKQKNSLINKCDTLE